MNRSVFTLAILALFPISEARAQPKPDPDWPCVQRKVPTLAAGTVWSGPSLDEAGPWGSDFEAAALAQKLASRRTPMSEVDQLVDEFAKSTGDEKEKRLTRVFAGVLELINTERSRVMAGIERYGRGQRQLAERIRDEADQISAVHDAPEKEVPKELAEVENRFTWDKRIFEERTQALEYVCETPVLLEQRLFEIARVIQSKL